MMGQHTDSQSKDAPRKQAKEKIAQILEETSLGDMAGRFLYYLLNFDYAFDLK